MEEETQQVVKYSQQLEAELEAERQKSQELTRGTQNLFTPEERENLIVYQLDMKEDLDNISHLLKGERKEVNDNGELEWKEAEDDELKPFNEYGVQLIMNILAFYLNRNTILSNYAEETIDWKVKDFGDRLIDLIHNKYEKMMITIADEKINGMVEEITDPEEKLLAKRMIIQEHIAEKIKLVPMIHGKLVDTVHSAYLRAYRGGERESLRTARTVTQMQPLVSGNQPQFNQQPKQSKWYNPGSWGK